jgi:filamentous hemagglutinin family protein
MNPRKYHGIVKHLNVQIKPLSAALIAAGCISLWAPAFAEPQGGVVRAGQADIRGNGALTQVIQNSDRAVIDWRGFDIATHEVVQFLQPAASSAVLNRIGGNQSSQIDGQLLANGQVFLVNPYGVIFGRDAKINVGSLIAATANISNQDFMSGLLRFDQPGMPAASIRNAGTLTAAEGGLIALVAPSVRNDGILSARLGKVALASGEAFTLDLYGDNLIRFAINERQAASLLDADGHTLGRQLEHAGTIDAAGGKVVFMTTAAGKLALDQVVNLSGVVWADSVASSAGKISLLAPGAKVTVSGALNARGLASDEHGGTIELIADSVVLQNAHLDVSGTHGGGTVHVGGDWQGRGDGLRAQQLHIDSGSTVKADAIEHGSGGEVVFWSDGQTQFAGSISARGGAAGGNGGRVEVSGKHTLSFAGDVDAGAPAGLPGMLLLDPETLSITALDAGVLSRILRTGTSTSLQAGLDIFLNAPISGLGLYSGGGISLSAGRNLAINDFIVTNNGAVQLTARDGTVTFASGKGVFAGNAPIVVSGAGTLSTGNLVTTGAMWLTSLGGDVHVDQPIAGEVGDVHLDAHGDVAINAPIVNLRSGAALDINAGGDIRVNAPIDGQSGVPGGAVKMTAGRSVTIADFIATNAAPITVVAAGRADITSSGGLFAGSGPIQIMGSLGVNLGGTVSSQNRVDLSAQAGSIRINSPFVSTNGNLFLDAGQDISVNQALLNLQSGASLSVAARRNIEINARIDGAQHAPGSAGVSGGAVLLDAGQNLVVNESISTDSGAITARSGGQTRFATGAGLYAGNAAVSLSAGSGLDTGEILTTGSINLTPGSGALALHGAIQGGSEPISISSPTDLKIGQPITVGSNGTLSLASAGNLFLESYISGGSNTTVAIRAGGDATVSQPIVIAGGSITANAGRNLTFLGAGGAYAGSGSVVLQAGGNLNTGVIVASGPISLSSGSSLSITQGLVFGAGGLSAVAGLDLGINAPIHGLGATSATLAAGRTVILARDIAIDSGSLNVSGNSGVSFGAGGLYGGAGSVAVYSGGDIFTGTLQGAGGVGVASGGSITVSTAIGSDAGSVGLSAAGSIYINSPIANIAGALSTAAGGNIEVNARVDNIGGGIGLVAGHDVLVNQDVVSANSPISVSAAGSVVLAPNGNDSYGAPQTRQLRAGNGPISVTAGQTINTGSMVTSGALSVRSTGGDININVPVYETTGNTLFVAAGNININQVVANTTTGANLVMQAGGDINVSRKVGPWDRSDNTYPTINRNALPGGQISLTAVGNININQPIATYKGNLTSPDAGALSLVSTGGSVNIPSLLKVSSDKGSIRISSYDSLDNGPALAPADVNQPIATGYFTTGSLSLTSTHGNVTINQTIPDTTGPVTISAGNGVFVNQRIYSNNADIRIIAGLGGISQSWAVDPNSDTDPVYGFPLSTGFVSDIDAGNGNLYLEAIGDIHPTSVRTGGHLTIKSTHGWISGGGVLRTRQGSIDQIDLAGYSGITGFNTGDFAPVINAISTTGSITNLAVNAPSLTLVAAEDITGIPVTLNRSPRLYAGRDISFRGGIAGALVAKAGRDLSITHALLNDNTSLDADSAVLSAGTNPFLDIANLTIAGVQVPTWAGPFDTSIFGNITLGPAGSTTWIMGNTGGLAVTASGDISLRRTHVSYGEFPYFSPPPIVHAPQPFTVTAGRNVSIEQIETTEPISITSTQGNITVSSTIGAHVAVVANPAEWNPTDLGAASVNMVAQHGNINMHEVRAEGNISIAAPKGQVAFANPSYTGIQSTFGARSISDSNGVTYTDTINLATVPRIPHTPTVSPAISVGPTIAGPGAPPIPGALPPAAPGGVSIGGVAPSIASASAPGQSPSGATGAPGAVSATGASPGMVNVANTVAPETNSGDSFGEIFVAEVTVPTAGDEPIHFAGAEPETLTDATPDSTNIAAKGPSFGLPTLETENFAGPILVFSAGRGEARETDFGREDRLDSGRVRP